ncbi:MAG: hypothetical protein AB8B56_11175 [Crocinitomicaceae bacterium]
MRAHIKPTHQIQRINSLLNRLEEFKTQDRKTFMIRPTEKAWSGAEVLKHMIIAHGVYEEKVENALLKLKPVNEEVDVVSTRAIPSFLIKRFPPKDGKIRFKMKTMKTFKPMLDVNELSENDVNDLLTEMQKTLNQLSSWVEQTRKNDVLPIRFNSAVGAIVKFNASEACEFILCHNERHFQQLTNTISS